LFTWKLNDDDDDDSVSESAYRCVGADEDGKVGEMVNCARRVCSI